MRPMTRPALSLRQIRYFVALAETGSFRGAAAQSGVSQPSLSKPIALMEEAMGLTLLERGPTGTVLTPAGRTVRELRQRPGRNAAAGVHRHARPLPAAERGPASPCGPSRPQAGNP